MTPRAHETNEPPNRIGYLTRDGSREDATLSLHSSRAPSSVLGPEIGNSAIHDHAHVDMECRRKVTYRRRRFKVRKRFDVKA